MPPERGPALSESLLEMPAIGETIVASTSEVFDEARAGRPFHVQPSPRAAASVSPTPGRWHTPTTISPSISKPEQDAKERHAVDEAAGAVDGSTNQRCDAPPAIGADLLADDRMRRIARGETRANERSAPTSAAVTGDRSALSSTSIPRWWCESTNAPASVASATAVIEVFARGRLSEPCATSCGRWGAPEASFDSEGERAALDHVVAHLFGGHLGRNRLRQRAVGS